MDDKPPEHPTVEFASPPSWAIDLIQNQKAGFAAVNGRLDTMETNLDLQGDTVRDVAQRMTAMEIRQHAYEARAGSNSISVKRESANNLEQDAAIAAIKIDLASVKEETTTQTAILKRLDAVAANPIVRKVAYGVGILIWGYLVGKGLVSK